MHVAIRAVCRNFAEEGRVGVYGLKKGMGGGWGGGAKV